MQDQWNEWIKEINGYLARVGVNKFLKEELPWDFLDQFTNLMEIKESDLKGIIQEGCVVEGNIHLGKKSRILFPSVIDGNGYIGENVVVGPFAYLRGNFLIGDNASVGRTEFKNSIILSGSRVAHFSYIGDSVIGRNCNLGAGTKTANLRLDEKQVIVRIGEKKYDSRKRKLGTIMEDEVKVGCNVVFNPGSYVQRGTLIFPNEVYLRK